LQEVRRAIGAAEDARTALHEKERFFLNQVLPFKATTHRAVPLLDC
jgi:hypothetical protein